MKDLIVCTSDQHVGSSLAICPPSGFQLEDGGIYKPSLFQEELYYAWVNLFREMYLLKNIKRRIWINIGDTIDGDHHNTVALVTRNITTQIKGAIELMKPPRELFDHFYMTSGTPVHVGQGGCNEEIIAQALEAKPDDIGNHVRRFLNIRVQGVLLDLMHHIGTAYATHTEIGALNRELANVLSACSRWNKPIPNIVGRGHRHMYDTASLWSGVGEMKAFTTPAWQLKTEFVYKTNNRNQLPQIGGVFILVEDNNWLIYPKIFPLKTAPVETI